MTWIFFYNVLFDYNVFLDYFFNISFNACHTTPSPSGSPKLPQNIGIDEKIPTYMITSMTLTIFFTENFSFN